MGWSGAGVAENDGAEREVAERERSVELAESAAHSSLIVSVCSPH